jgi:hypothetical protein
MLVIYILAIIIGIIIFCYVISKACMHGYLDAIDDKMVTDYKYIKKEDEDKKKQIEFQRQNN